MEQNEALLVGQGHESDEENVEHDRDNHQSGVEVHQRRILHEAILLHQTLLYDPEEVPVQTGVHKTDQTLGGPIPVLVDINISVTQALLAS